MRDVLIVASVSVLLVVLVIVAPSLRSDDTPTPPPPPTPAPTFTAQQQESLCRRLSFLRGFNRMTQKAILLDLGLMDEIGRRTGQPSMDWVTRCVAMYP